MIMKLYDRKGTKYDVKSASKPKFTSHRGRTWDFMEASINNEHIEMHLDTTWGFYLYFEYKGRWRKISVAEVDYPKITYFTTSPNLSSKEESLIAINQNQ